MRHTADLIAYALSLPHLVIVFRPDNSLGFHASTADDKTLYVLFGRGHYADNRFYDYRVGLESQTVELSGFGVPVGSMPGEPQPYVPVAEAAEYLRKLNDHGANLAFHRPKR